MSSWEGLEEAVCRSGFPPHELRPHMQPAIVQHLTKPDKSRQNLTLKRWFGKTNPPLPGGCVTSSEADKTRQKPTLFRRLAKRTHGGRNGKGDRAVHSLPS